MAAHTHSLSILTFHAIDARASTITLKRSWLDEPKTFKVNSGVVNLSRIRVGDVVHAEVIEEVAVTLVPGGAPPEIDAAAVVALSAPGDKPAIVAAESVQVTAEIIAIDMAIPTDGPSFGTAPAGT